jgi:hypothetical protein
LYFTTNILCHRPDKLLIVAVWYQFVIWIISMTTGHKVFHCIYWYEKGAKGGILFEKGDNEFGISGFS